MKASTAARILIGIGGFLLVGTLMVALNGDPQAGDLARQVVFLIAFVGGLFWLGHRFRVLPRRRSFGDQADVVSFRAEAGDPQHLLDLPFALFRWIGSVRAVENTATGTHGGVPTTIADYWFAPKGAAQYDDYERYTCVLVLTDPTWSDLSVVPERLGSRTLGAIGLRDQELESDAFNRAFHVRAADSRFASAIVDARMMAWLLEQQGVGFEILGGRLMLFRRRKTASLDDLSETLALYEAFRERIPRVVTAAGRS